MTRKLSAAGRRLQIIPGCIVSKTCELMAPANFHVEEKSLSAVVVNSEPSDEELPGVIEAIKFCPEKVIKFRKIDES